VAAGVLLGPHHERNVTWHAGGVRATRARGATVWLTGLPASGKSTIADALEERLAEAGVPAYRLDGDNLRHGLNSDLGFAAEDREENVRRTGEVARLMADAGLIAIVAVVSPYASGRDAARATHVEAELDFVEVWVDTPLAECERRDPKGLYARARSGEVRGLTGIDDPYEAPPTPELRLRPDDAEPPAERIWRALADRGLVPRSDIRAR
jgi:bifunctional enzyme CysN/CysC